MATTMQIEGEKDNNLVFGELCFYDIITKICELD